MFVGVRTAFPCEFKRPCRQRAYRPCRQRVALQKSSVGALCRQRAAFQKSAEGTSPEVCRGHKSRLLEVQKALQKSRTRGDIKGAAPYTSNVAPKLGRHFKCRP